MVALAGAIDAYEIRRNVAKATSSGNRHDTPDRQGLVSKPAARRTSKFQQRVALELPHGGKITQEFVQFWNMFTCRPTVSPCAGCRSVLRQRF